MAVGCVLLCVFGGCVTCVSCALAPCVEELLKRPLYAAFVNLCLFFPALTKPSRRHTVVGGNTLSVGRNGRRTPMASGLDACRSPFVYLSASCNPAPLVDREAGVSFSFFVVTPSTSHYLLFRLRPPFGFFSVLADSRGAFLFHVQN